MSGWIVLALAAVLNIVMFVAILVINVKNKKYQRLGIIYGSLWLAGALILGDFLLLGAFLVQLKAYVALVFEFLLLIAVCVVIWQSIWKIVPAANPPSVGLRMIWDQIMETEDAVVSAGRQLCLDYFPFYLNILISDDQAIVRKGIRALLATEPNIEVIGEAENGLEAVSRAEELQPDVILMDLVMPEMDGIEAIRRVTAGQPDARILVLTSFATDDKVFPAIKAGALGYLLKDSSPE